MSNSGSVAAVANGDCVVVRFSTADYSPRERFDAWREIYGRTLQRLDIEPLSVEQFHAEATMLRTPGLALMTGRRSASMYRRRREFIDHDDVGFTCSLSTSFQVHQFGQTLDLGCGQAIVLTGAEPAFLRVPKLGNYINLRVPVCRLSPLIADLDAAYCRPIPADNPALQLLTRYISVLNETEAFVTPELRRQAVVHVHDLIALAIGATRDAAEIAKSRGGRAARLRAIKEDIAAWLDRPDLSVTAIAARHRIKPRWVQRVFESEGTTFTEYVLGQRLVRAHRLLIDARYSGQKISTIAFNVGFGDLSYFNRAFRRRYGVTPSELRAAATSGG